MLLTLGRYAIVASLVMSGAVLQASTIDVKSADWSTSGSSAITVTSTANQISFGLANANAYNASWTFSSTATADTTVAYSWDFTGLFSWYFAEETVTAWAYDSTGALQSYTLSDSSVYDNFHFNGSDSLAVAAGKSYGFTVDGYNEDYSQILEGTFTLSNPTPVPEPVSALLILPCLVVLAGFRAHCKRK